MAKSKKNPSGYPVMTKKLNKTSGQKTISQYKKRIGLNKGRRGS